MIPELLLCLLALVHAPTDTLPSVEIPERIAASLDSGSRLLVEVQEGSGGAEWPYEGVYRVRAIPSDPKALVKGRVSIPIGYRVGGTGICAQAMFQAPDYATHPDRVEAVGKAIDFVCLSIEDPRMSPEDYQGGYDVRGWGYIYGLRMLLAAHKGDVVSESRTKKVSDTIEWFIAALDTIEIPRIGGWNYARQGGADQASPTSPFMTAPALIALFDARAQGFDVDPSMVDRALTGLKRCVAPDGYVSYSGSRQTADNPGQIPGAIGRMVSAESALFLAGRSDQKRLSKAVDDFFEHWQELEKRRRKNGTHDPPYGVAPYYFFYGFNYCAEAIELLPETARESARKRLREILFQVRETDGSWNDRVFKRSRAFGTAMTMNALQKQWLPAPVAWPGTRPTATPAGEPDPDPAVSSP
ncbi:MAG: hypothetical protein CMJ53_04830 [Planctomycetaceae bacterium]|nr:hypothetical protein [Planctomycetaceae bacterium]